MDLIKCGNFIAEKRRERKLTQKELAQRLCVSDKAVSKWETGRGFPDTALLSALAEELGVTVTELVNGEPTEPENSVGQTENAVLEALNYSKRMSRVTIGSIFILLGVFALILSGCVLGMNTAVFQLGGAALLVAGGLLVAAGRLKTAPKKSASGALSLLLAGAALIAEIPPHAIAMRFGAPPGERNPIVYCSYFDLLPFGYGTFTPLFTAAATCLVVLLGILWFLFAQNQKVGNADFVCGIIAVLLSVGHLPLTAGLTFQSGLVTGLLVCSVVARAFANR